MIFLVDLHYEKPLPDVDAHLEAHRDFLRRHYAAAHFLASGPKVPRTGGLILATAASLDELEGWLREDPLHREGIASHTVVAWTPTMAAHDLLPTLGAAGAACMPRTAAPNHPLKGN